MASRSKCTQIFALLGAIFMPLLQIPIFLYILLWFPISETFGLEVEKSIFGEWREEYIVNTSGIHVSIGVLMYDLILIFCLGGRKITLEQLRKERESVGPFLLEVINTLRVSINQDYVYI